MPSLHSIIDDLNTVKLPSPSVVALVAAAALTPAKDADSAGTRAGVESGDRTSRLAIDDSTNLDTEFSSERAAGNFVVILDGSEDQTTELDSIMSMPGVVPQDTVLVDSLKNVVELKSNIDVRHWFWGKKFGEVDFHSCEINAKGYIKILFEGRFSTHFAVPAEVRREDEKWKISIGEGPNKINLEIPVDAKWSVRVWNKGDTDGYKFEIQAKYIAGNKSVQQALKLRFEKDKLPQDSDVVLTHKTLTRSRNGGPTKKIEQGPVTIKAVDVLRVVSAAAPEPPAAGDSHP